MSAIVMLHGWGVNASVFDALRRRLSSHHTVSAPDLAGYRGSPRCAPPTLEDLAQRLAARAPRRCFAVGWSLGAQIALAWARAQPQQVERLALIAATPCFVQREDWTCAMARTVLDAFADALARNRRGTLARFASLQAQGDDDARGVAKQLRAALAARALPDAIVLENGLRILRESDLRPSLHAVEQEALIVHGDRDQLVPTEAADYLARALPHGRLASVAGAAHAPFLSRPERVGAMVQEFFDAR